MCDHVADAGKTKVFGNPDFNGTRPSREATKIEGYYFKDLCGKCGARRIDQQIGLEETPEQYVAKLVEVFREVRRVLRDDGTLWLNLGDSYASNTKGTGGTKSLSGGGTLRPNGHSQPQMPAYKVNHGVKEKDLIGIPWMTAFALRADGWWLRSEIIWHKRAPMPESVTDRPTKAHEQVFLLSKQANYFYDAEAIAEAATDCRPRPPKENRWEGESGHDTKAGFLKGTPAYFTRNKRSVWTLGPESYAGAHFATMPTKLVEPCILAGSRVGDTVLDPFCGSGTTLAVALKHHRNGIGIELNESYISLAHDRIRRSQPMLLDVTA